MAADSKTVSAPDTVSPKVFWPLVVGIALTFVATFLAAVTPDMLSSLGPFAVPMATSLVSMAAVITGWLKNDSLRSIGSDATAAILPVAPTSQVTVPLPPSDVLVDPAAQRGEPDTAAQLEAELSQLDRASGGGSTAV